VTFEEARAAFPVLERLAYLNAGSMGPLPRPVVEAAETVQRGDLDRGRGGRAYYDRLLELRARVRAKLAALVGVDATQVALTSSTTESCRIVLAGLELGPDDEIVTTDGEHFGLLGPLHASGARVRVARVRDRPAAEAFDAIRAEVGPRTRLLALMHVSWVTGHVLPVEQLREATGLPVLADGAQSAGAIPVDASRLDFFTVSAQKWLCGPDGTGALVVADPDRLRVALPSYFSQQSYEPDGAFTAKPGASRFDPGWIALPALAGLEAALDFHPDWRYERAAATAARCRELLAERFDVVTEPGHSTLVTFRIDGDPAEAAARAYERGVLIRDLPGTPWLRASCGYWTSDDDLERLVAALTSRDLSGDSPRP
jgi:L-cysteine/cystine lyase